MVARTRTEKINQIPFSRRMKCNICKKLYSPECDYNQGRCPHHPPLLEIKMKDLTQLPDPTKHKYISFAKSGIRILAGIALCYNMLTYAGLLLILAEGLGILEEMV